VNKNHFVIVSVFYILFLNLQHTVCSICIRESELRCSVDHWPFIQTACV